MNGAQVATAPQEGGVRGWTTQDELRRAINGSPSRTLLLTGDSAEVLQQIPSNSIDFAMTSPPYWGHRDYESGGIGQEPTVQGYVDSLLEVFSELKRVLKPEGSFWLNLGDTYRTKALQGVPWRVALAMIDEQKWTLRNDIVWNKVKGAPDNSKDKLRNIHEYVFHFVKDAKKTYYDTDAIRAQPRKASNLQGKTISATGVSGIRYRRKIQMSTELSSNEKEMARAALDEMLSQVASGKISDFRMVIRGVHRVTHSDSIRLSGRAKELAEKGFYFLRYHPKGAKPSDVWEIIPEDTHGRKKHYAPYPEELCMVPLQATCPENGIAIDPFAGTGTTLVAARRLGRCSIGIDIADSYVKETLSRLEVIQ